ncbi:MAG: hypothetical protein AB1832_01210 [Pseudomonadota bacterium]
MTLKLQKINTFKARVAVALLTSDPDRSQEASFVAEFKHLSTEEFQGLMNAGKTDAQFLDEVLVGVEEVAGASGESVAFEDAKRAIQNDLNYCAAAVRTFIEKLSGAAGKNSNRSR